MATANQSSSPLSSSPLSPASSPLIICDNLVKIYKVADLEIVALQGLDLVIEAGELLGIVGASGSGKTSLMNILGGLDRPSAGRAWVDGHDLLKLSNAALDRYRRTQVGFIWQQGARNLVPYLNALENVRLPMTLIGHTGRSARHQAEALLDAVGLADRRTYHLAQMSGGEQQRVAIAVALANNPSLLLADEPTGEVDSETALVIYDTLRRLNQEFGLTTLIVSHDPDLTHHVDRVVAIRDGQTASETVRQKSQVTADDQETEVEEVFEELVVLDSAGRLQIPKEVLAQFDIKGRAKIEVGDEGIVIKSAPQTEQREAGEAVDELAARPKISRLRRWWQQWRQG